MKWLALLALELMWSGAFASTHPFTVDDMWSMQRVGKPVASPNGQYIVFDVLMPDMNTNKTHSNLYVIKADGEATPLRLTTSDAKDLSPQWSSDNRTIYFLSSRSGAMQLWRIAVSGGEAEQVSHYDTDISAYKLSPDTNRILLGFEIMANCKDIACNSKAEAAVKDTKATGKQYDQLFVRHWDTWKDGHVGKLFIDDLHNGNLANKPSLLVDLDADVESSRRRVAQVADDIFEPGVGHLGSAKRFDISQCGARDAEVIRPGMGLG